MFNSQKIAELEYEVKSKDATIAELTYQLRTLTKRLENIHNDDATLARKIENFDLNLAVMPLISIERRKNQTVIAYYNMHYEVTAVYLDTDLDAHQALVTQFKEHKK